MYKLCNNCSGKKKKLYIDAIAFNTHYRLVCHEDYDPWEYELNPLSNNLTNYFFYSSLK